MTDTGIKGSHTYEHCLDVRKSTLKIKLTLPNMGIHIWEMFKMAEAVAMIADLRFVEKKFGSILKAPAKYVKAVQEDAKELPKVEPHYGSCSYVRLDTNNFPLFTSDSRMLKAWKQLAFGAGIDRTAYKFHLSSNYLNNVRHYKYRWVYKRSNGNHSTVTNPTVKGLLNKLRIKDIYAPHTRPAFLNSMHAYNEGESIKWNGHGEKICFMRKLVFIKSDGERVNAKIPLPLRKHASNE